MAYDQTTVKQILEKAKIEGRHSLSASEGKLVCNAYSIAVPKEAVATSAAEAVSLAQKMGFPVVLKIISPDILQKTEAGGVLVYLKSAQEVEKGFDTIIANAKKHTPDADILGIQVQQMLVAGHEVIVGAVTDPSFGKLVAFGLGGVLVEVLEDITFRLAPTTSEEALSMLDRITAADTLKGEHGGEVVNRKALAALIQNVSQLVTDFPEIQEMDLNPIFATADHAVTADIRILLDFSPSPFSKGTNFNDLDKLKDNRSLKKKPVIALKARRTNLETRTVCSHTGALATDEKIYEDILKQSGVICADSFHDLLEFSRTLPIMPTPKGENVIIITGAAGSGDLLSEACVKNNLSLMDNPKNLDAAFRQCVPFNIIEENSPEIYRKTIQLGLEDPRVGAIILGYWHTTTTPPMVFAKLVVEVIAEMKEKGIEKPIVASLGGDVEVEAAAKHLFAHKIPAYAYSTDTPVAVLSAKYKWERASL